MSKALRGLRRHLAFFFKKVIGDEGPFERFTIDSDKPVMVYGIWRLVFDLTNER